MPTLTYILLFTLLGSIVSLAGGLILLYKEKFAISIAHYLTSFAAGVLLSTAFFDLLPEAAHEAQKSGIDIFLWTAVGFSVLFLIERFIHWFHHHSHEHIAPKKDKSIIPLLIISDTTHNFIDGVVIALTFLVNVPLGIITSFAIIAHEIPQEIGDFGIMLNRGVKRGKILLINIFSALSAIIGALIAYFAGERITSYLPIFLSIAAGFFIYIAASDLIPEIHHQDKRNVALIQTILLFLGMLLVYTAVSILDF